MILRDRLKKGEAFHPNLKGITSSDSVHTRMPHADRSLDGARIRRTWQYVILVGAFELPPYRKAKDLAVRQSSVTRNSMMEQSAFGDHCATRQLEARVFGHRLEA